MSKRQPHNKSNVTTNRVGTSISIAVENPTYEDIQIRAYQIHEEKGGSDLENWLEAERTLKNVKS